MVQTTHLDPGSVEEILAAYHEIAEGNGALAAVAYDDHGEVFDEVCDVAHDLGFGEIVDDAHEALLLAVSTYRAKLAGRFERKTLVVRLPAIVDLEKVNANAAPEAVIVEGIRSAVATVPFLELEEVDSFEVVLAVRLESRSC